MRRLILVLFSCCLMGCGSRSEDASKNTAPDGSTKATLSFREQQKRLFDGIDHKLVYQGCQELLRLHREGKLSAGTYYCDDPAARLDELPGSLRVLQPTAVQVDELMVRMSFLSEDGVQFLQCISNEFGEPAAPDGEVKGFGFRSEPFAMDRLTGTESLDHLNATYRHFEVSLIPGLTYQVFNEESPQTLDELKRMNEGMDKMFAFVQKSVSELAVKKQRLLHKTDHHALLAACRELMQRVSEGTLSAASIHLMPEEVLSEATHIDREKYEKDIRQVPEIILRLEPGSVSIADDGVTIALIGGFDHAGVVAYMDAGDAEARSDTMKLIDGLWYYDDGLEEAGDDYKEYLKSLEYEAMAPIDWQRKRMNLPLPLRE